MNQSVGRDLPKQEEPVADVHTAIRAGREGARVELLSGGRHIVGLRLERAREGPRSRNRADSLRQRRRRAPGAVSLVQHLAHRIVDVLHVQREPAEPERRSVECPDRRLDHLHQRALRPRRRHSLGDEGTDCSAASGRTRQPERIHRVRRPRVLHREHVPDEHRCRLRALGQSPVDVLPVPAERVREVRRGSERPGKPLPGDVHLELHPDQLRLERRARERDVELAVRRVALGPIARVVESEGAAHEAHRLERGLRLEPAPDRVSLPRAAPRLHLAVGRRGSDEDEWEVQIERLDSRSERPPQIGPRRIGATQLQQFIVVDAEQCQRARRVGLAVPRDVHQRPAVRVLAEHLDDLAVRLRHPRSLGGVVSAHGHGRPHRHV